MTRDEAIHAVNKLKFSIRCGENSWLVDALVALGVLKLEKPKNAEMTAGEIINEHTQDGTETATILQEIADAGIRFSFISQQDQEAK